MRNTKIAQLRNVVTEEILGTVANEVTETVHLIGQIPMVIMEVDMGTLLLQDQLER